MQAFRKFGLTALLAGLLCAVGARPSHAAPVPGSALEVASDLNKWLMEGAEFVLRLNVKQMLNSDLVKTLDGKANLKKAIEGNDKAKEVFEATGIDPLTDLNSLTVSGAGAGKDIKALVVVRGKFNLEKIQNAAEKFARIHADQLELSKSDDVQLYEIKNKDKGSPTFAAFQDSSTLVITPSKEATLEQLKTVGKRSARVNRDLQTALSAFTGKETLALALTLNEDLKKGLGKANPIAAEIAPSIQAVVGVLNLTEAATLQVNVNTDDEKAATKVLQLAKQGKGIAQTLAASNEEIGPIASDLLDALKIQKSKTNVSVTLTVTEEAIKKLQKLKDKGDK